MRFFPRSELELLEKKNDPRPLFRIAGNTSLATRKGPRQAMCCAVDRELRIVYVNRSLEELIQQPRHRLMGKAIAGGLLPCGTRSRRDLNPSPKRSARGSKVTFIKAIRDIRSIFRYQRTTDA